MISAIPFAMLKAKVNSVGVDGDLVILSGQTVDIPAGSFKQYTSVNIASGGTLRITGNTGAWTEIECLKNFICNGTIIARAGYSGQTTHNGGTFTRVSSMGLGTLSYTIAQAVGGAGGKGGTYSSSHSSMIGGAGGAQANGIGGGGGGSASVTKETGHAPAGAGGAGGSNGGGYSGRFGLGNSTLGAGGNGGTANVSGVNYGSGKGGAGGGGGGGAGAGDSLVALAAGGGGGYKGRHGKGLAIKVWGVISGTGTINASGENGYAGGAGGAGIRWGSYPYGCTGGGGGGGGAGGSGGKVVLRYKAGTPPTISVARGTGGAGGAGGTDTQTYHGVAGGSGSNGYNGSTDVSKF